VDGRDRHVLLISCLGEQTGGGLFEYDGERLERLDTLSTTGLALGGRRLARLLWSSGESGSVGELLLYDEVGVERYLRLDALREPHDLVWDGETFAAVSTLSNSVLWISAGGDVVRTWQGEGDGDSWHLNSLSIVEGKLVASAFGRFSRHREWSNGSAAGAGIVFDLESGEDLVHGLDCPHDPRLVDGLWHVCNSGRKELLAVDPSDGRVVRRLELEGWTRGLEVGDDVLYVGESANRAEPSPEHLASVVLVDRRTWGVVGRVPLPCQEVFDVIRVPQPLAEAVRRGFRTNPLRTAEQDQHYLFNEVGVQPSRLWAVGVPLPPAACRIGIRAEVTAELEPDTLQEAACTVANHGDAILVSAPPNPVHISYRWVNPEDPDAEIEGLRTPLPETLPPGDERVYRFSLRTPETPGRYHLLVTLVQEQVAWFDHLDAANAWRKDVRITRAAAQ
jgi:acetolactate synthase-1/2/3 large subunit